MRSGESSVTLFLLGIPFTVACAPELLAVALRNSPPEAGEGFGYLLFVIGAAAVVVTGPLGGVLLNPLVRSAKVSLAAYVVLLMIASGPIFYFEATAHAVSVLPLIVASPATGAAILVAWYLCYAVVSHVLARRTPSAAIAGTVGWALVTVGSIAAAVARA